MMIRIVAAALLGLGVGTAFAGEGNGDPFPSHSLLGTRSTRAAALAPDTGAAAYPDFAGCPGADLPGLAVATLPSDGAEGAVQTVGSLPRNFGQGTVLHAQSRSVRRWMLAHSGHTAPALAASRPSRPGNG